MTIQENNTDGRVYEFLTDFFGMDEHKATWAAAHWNFGLLESSLLAMEKAVGTDAMEAIVTKGNFLQYTSEQVQEFLALASQGAELRAGNPLPVAEANSHYTLRRTKNYVNSTPQSRVQKELSPEVYGREGIPHRALQRAVK